MEDLEINSCASRIGKATVAMHITLKHTEHAMHRKAMGMEAADMAVFGMKAHK